MRRIDIKELHEYGLCPGVLRDGLTDILSFIWKTGSYTRAIRSISRLMKITGTRTMTDLCSGAGGYLPPFRKILEKKGLLNLRIIRTDLFPYKGEPGPGVEACSEPLTAENALEKFEGVATMFSAIHHFREEELYSIFAKAASTGHAIAFFDIAQRRIFTDILPNLFLPPLIWLITPFIRPFRLSRFIFTYPLPLIPLLVAVDGFFSHIRAYRTAEIKAITAPLEEQYPDYIFMIGNYPLLCGLKRVTYVLGCSIRSENSPGKAYPSWNRSAIHKMS